jgi:hypothetical protein
MSHPFQRVGVFAALVIGAFLSTTVCHAEAKSDSQPDFTEFKAQDYQRPYGPGAPWNVPLKGIPDHPESGLWVERLWRLSTAARPGNFNLGGFENYSYPVYLAGDATASVPVRARHPDWGNLHGKEVLWNPNWKPAAGSDGQVIILDPATGREWNLWQVRFDGQTLNIGNGNLVDGDYRSKEDGFPSSRGAGIPYLAMLTRPEEIMQGAIRHALSMPAKNPSSTLFVPPATKTDGDKFGIPEGVPEGMRFGLRVTDDEIEDWIRQLPGELGETTRRSARIIARALRDYGWIITDNSGGAFFQFEHDNTAGEKWKVLGLGKVKIAGKEYPQDLLDGLLTAQRMYAVVPSDQYPAAVGNRVEITYAGDDTIFANPERGWFVFGELKPHGDNINSWATDALLENYHVQGYRLAKHVVMIPRRSGPIPQSFLDDLQREADLIRKHGFKVIYRFNYNWNHDINNEDAPIAVTLSHLEQLRPFFTANTDVLFAMEMGFIGFWGEMHSSTQGHTVPKTVGLSESGQSILRKALEVFPQERFVAVRYPQMIYRDPTDYGSLGFRKPLDEASAYNGSEQSRLAAWYANFGAGDILYHRDAELLSQWASETRYVPMWAHCDHFEDVTMDPREWLEMARMFHFVALSNPKDESSTRDIFDRWIKDGAYDNFAKKLGYRFRLVRAELPKTLRPGSGCEVKIEMANDGFARVTNPRAVELILRGPATYAVRLDDARGNRLWLPGPGETKTLAFTAGLPADMPPGDYEVLLNLPDPQPSLANRADYSIRLANDKIWEAESGFNRLLHTIQIDPNADGQRYQGALQFTPFPTLPPKQESATLPKAIK